MNRFSALALLAAGIGVAAVLTPRIGHAQSTHTGTVKQVWEDGFHLKAGDQMLRVDAWEVYGDYTAGQLEVGDRITITGEFEGLEFDAFSITDSK